MLLVTRNAHMYVVVLARLMIRWIVRGEVTVVLENSPTTASEVVFEKMHLFVTDAHRTKYLLMSWPPLSVGTDHTTQMLLG